jgi:hypothetical protein
MFFCEYIDARIEHTPTLQYCSASYGAKQPKEAFLAALSSLDSLGPEQHHTEQHPRFLANSF